MKILQFTQKVLKISTMLPLLRESTMSRAIEILKLIVLIIPAIYLALTSIAYVIVNIDNSSLTSLSAVVFVGSLTSISLNVSFYSQTNRVARLFQIVEIALKESEYYTLRTVSERNFHFRY